LLGVRPSTIAYYTNEGFVVPEKANPKGRGTRRLYSVANLFQVLIIKELSQMGVPLKNIKKLMQLYKAERDELQKEVRQSAPSIWESILTAELRDIYLVFYDYDQDEPKTKAYLLQPDNLAGKKLCSALKFLPESKGFFSLLKGKRHETLSIALPLMQRSALVVSIANILDKLSEILRK